MELTRNEKRLLLALAPLKSADPATLAGELETSEESVIQYAHLCSEKNLARVDRNVSLSHHLTPEGEKYRDAGLPERQLYNSFGDSIGMKELQMHPLARIGIGWMKKKGWVTIKSGQVTKTGEAPEGADERGLARPESDQEGLKQLLKRGLVREEESVTYTISLTTAGGELTAGGLDLVEETGRLTQEQIISGDWENLRLRKFSVNTPPRRTYPGKIHPYQRLLNEMRQILLDMGFVEIYGNIVQSSFWNFDALFQPQDHPAREMQDTFFLDCKSDLPPGWEDVRDMHEHGGDTSSTGWGGTWSKTRAEQCVLRTHTTGLTIKYLHDNPEPPQKAFSIGRVYRREAIDPTHLPEFEQLEGVVMDRNVNFRHLLGFLREFYVQMGFEDVRFRPGYFPYTEPSVEPEVWVDGLGWVELGGAGIFREEVCAANGLSHPVLAWGLGVSRLAMLKIGLKDLRQLYRSDIDWVRESPVCDMRKERN
ncbi:MAG TPA: phenylalanine--tRNA ligase subunit alpha [Methanoregulaceae archaeon]|nr:phenylalanine--tRNA ligase subunit alpha [Methanoregulaceae archaeon]